MANKSDYAAQHEVNRAIDRALDNIRVMGTGVAPLRLRPQSEPLRKTLPDDHYPPYLR